VDPDTSVAEIAIPEAAESALQFAIDAMFMEGRHPDLFDDYHLRTMMYAAVSRGLDDDDQASSEGVDEA
jgi:hypothetical protein